MALVVELFYDLTCHDLPPQLEDGHERFFASEKGQTLRTDVRCAPFSFLHQLMTRM
jgi:hypothetical protein